MDRSRTSVQLTPGTGLYRIDLDAVRVVLDPPEDHVVLLYRFPAKRRAYLLTSVRKAFEDRFLRKKGPLHARHTVVDWDDLHGVLAPESQDEVGTVQAYARGEKALRVATTFIERFDMFVNLAVGDELQRGRAVDMGSRATSWLQIDGDREPLHAGSKPGVFHGLPFDPAPGAIPGVQKIRGFV